MTFKEDYRALFDQLQPSEQLLAATAAMRRRPNPKPGRRFRLPAVAVSLCTICLLIAGSLAGGLQLGQPPENQQPALRTAQQPPGVNRSIDAPDNATPETAMLSSLEPQTGAYSEDTPTPAAYSSLGKAGRTACYPQADCLANQMIIEPLRLANLWLTSPNLPTYFYQTALWLSCWKLGAQAYLYQTGTWAQIK